MEKTGRGEVRQGNGLTSEADGTEGDVYVFGARSGKLAFWCVISHGQLLAKCFAGDDESNVVVRKGCYSHATHRPGGQSFD